MNRIASTHQLRIELQALAAYAASPRPSRIVLACQLKELAVRVAKTFRFPVGDRLRMTMGLGAFRRGTVVRVMGRFFDSADQEKYMVRTGQGEQRQVAVDQLEAI